jgi:hypothetical protein
VFATRESELAAELGGDVEHQTDTAVRTAHTAALEAGRAVQDGRAQSDPAAAIAAAAGRAIKPWHRSRPGSSTSPSQLIPTRMATRRAPAAISPPSPTPSGHGGPRFPPKNRPIGRHCTETKISILSRFVPATPDKNHP